MSTVRDIAKRAGVSIATVSRVINDSSSVSVQARERVLEAMDELNYEKPPLKKRNPTKLFAVIVRNMTNPFFSQLVDVLEREAYRHGRSLLIFNSRNNLQLEKTFICECENHNVDGVFLIPCSLNREHLEPHSDKKFPVILLTNHSPYLSCVATDHYSGGQLVAMHLISKNHRRIGFVGMSDRGSDRFDGFVHTLIARGINLPSELILAPYDQVSLAAYIEREVVNSQNTLTAIFCSDDITGGRVRLALQQHPDIDETCIDIIGFDNTHISQIMGFASIKQPIQEIALKGFDLMLEQLSQESPTLKDIKLKPSLIARLTPDLRSLR